MHHLLMDADCTLGYQSNDYKNCSIDWLKICASTECGLAAASCAISFHPKKIMAIKSIGLKQLHSMLPKLGALKIYFPMRFSLTWFGTLEM